MAKQQNSPETEQEQQNSPEKGNYVVAIEFKDSAEWQIEGQQNTYSVGEDVTHLDAIRLESLIERGLVTKA